MKSSASGHVIAILVTTSGVLSCISLNCQPVSANDRPTKHYQSTFSYTTTDVELPLVQVRLNNNITGTFLIDTGANTSGVTDKMVRRLGLIPTAVYKEGKPYTLQGQPAEGVTLAPIQIGSVPLAQVTLLVVPERSFSSLGAHIDGVIGTNILSLFSIFFDFPRHKITLWYPAGLSADEINDAGFSRASVLAMTSPPDTGNYFVPIQLAQGGCSVQEGMLLDTGGGITIISKKSAQQLALAPISHDTQPSFRGSFPAKQVKLASIHIGGIEVANKFVKHPSDDRSDFPPILGMDILAGYRVLLDFPNKKMYIQPAQPAVTVSPAVKPPEAKTP